MTSLGTPLSDAYLTVHIVNPTQYAVRLKVYFEPWTGTAPQTLTIPPSPGGFTWQSCCMDVGVFQGHPHALSLWWSDTGSCAFASEADASLDMQGAYRPKGQQLLGAGANAAWSTPDYVYAGLDPAAALNVIAWMWQSAFASNTNGIAHLFVVCGAPSDMRCMAQHYQAVQPRAGTLPSLDAIRAATTLCLPDAVALPLYRALGYGEPPGNRVTTLQAAVGAAGYTCGDQTVCCSPAVNSTYSMAAPAAKGVTCVCNGTSTAAAVAAVPECPERDWLRAVLANKRKRASAVPT